MTPAPCPKCKKPLSGEPQIMLNGTPYHLRCRCHSGLDVTPAPKPRGPLSPAERHGVEQRRFSVELLENIATNLDDALRAALERGDRYRDKLHSTSVIPPCQNCAVFEKSRDQWMAVAQELEIKLAAVTKERNDAKIACEIAMDILARVGWSNEFQTVVLVKDKLAVAVEALEHVAMQQSNLPFIETARQALATIKGMK